jgi:hypothetical protein
MFRPRPAEGYGRYTQAKIQAKNLDELRAFCREHGEAAVIRAECQSANTWLMKGDEPSQPGASLALTAYHNGEMRRLGYPTHDGKPWPSGLEAFDAETQGHLRAIALETLEAWRAAGSPYLMHNIARTQQLLHSIRYFAGEFDNTEGEAA